MLPYPTPYPSSRRRAHPLRPAALALAALLLSACGSGGATATSGSAPAASGGLSGSITVFAAASLKEAFTTLGRQFQAVHPGTSVTFDFGASSTLATQITQKAPADVFAAASQKTMDTVSSAGLAVGPKVFAVNRLEIATPPHPTVAVTGLSDLTRPGVKVAVCQQEVPCGATALALFAQQHLAVTPVSQEVDVKAVLAKVELGEVDAGLVYVTDVHSAGSKVVGVPIPASQNVSTSYPITAVAGSPAPAVAHAFVDYVLSPAGQQVLTSVGFASP